MKASTIIDAPIKTVYDALLDFDSYPTWNSYVPSVIFKGLRPPNPEIGMRFTFVAHQKRGDSGIHSAEQLTLLEPGTTTCRVAWKSAAVPSSILSAERMHEMVESIDESGKAVTSYTTWETFGGLVGWIVKLSQGQLLVDRFADWTNDLKAHVEGMLSSNSIEMCS